MCQTRELRRAPRAAPSPELPMPIHAFTLAAVDIDLTIDPDNNNASCGPAYAITVLGAGTVNYQTGKGTTDLPINRSITFTALQVPAVIQTPEITKVLGTSTISSFIATWGPSSVVLLPTGSGGGVTTVTANQGTPNGGGAQAWPVQGAVADGGASATGAPVLIAGKLSPDGTSVKIPLVNSAGQLFITGPVIQSTSPWVTQDAATGSTGVAPPSKVIQIGVANSGGNLVGITQGQAQKFASIPVTIASDDGLSGTVVATSNTAPANAIQIGVKNGAGNLVALSLGQAAMSLSVPVAFASNQSSLGVTQGTSPWVTADQATAATGGGVPARAIYLGVNQGGNLVGLTTGQAVAANALPVVLPALQNAVGVTGAAAPTNAMYLGGVNGGNLTALTVGSASGLETQETLAPQAEDNANAVYAFAQKPLPVSTYSPSLFTNKGANATLNVKASAGNILSIYCENANAAVRYIQVHNTATVPGGGAVPLLVYQVPAAVAGVSGVTAIGAEMLGLQGNNFSTGLAFAFSSTSGTYTAGAAADQNTTLEFV